MVAEIESTSTDTPEVLPTNKDYDNISVPTVLTNSSTVPPVSTNNSTLPSSHFIKLTPPPGVGKYYVYT